MMNITPITDNPYVGPRTFTRQESDRFFGREREARDLFSLVVSERLVLFYAQSGAGKSSLINTRLIPQLQEAGFAVLPVGRVSGELPPGVGEVDNIFAFNLMLNLDQGEDDPGRFSHTPLTDFLAGLTSDDGEHYYYYEAEPAASNGQDEAEIYAEVPSVLIIDQFEEIITSHSTRWPEREIFFRQLDEAMAANPLLWVVLSLREDYVAALDPYAPILADKLRARFYMQRMGYEAALEAVKKPAEQGGRPFARGVAESLVDNLRQIRAGAQLILIENKSAPASQGELGVLGQFVEPVQLQVVCYQLWENLTARSVGEITQQDLQELGNVDVALADFYEQAIARVLAQTGESETYLRDWFERKLITEASTRGSVYRGAEKTGGLSTGAADLLVNQFLLRTETRAGGIWYELVHDRFVEPILKANQAWRLRQGALGQLDNVIVIELSEPTQTIEVEQTATYELAITNGGVVEARFQVGVQGLEPGWVTVTQPDLSLTEGQKAVVTINVSPPRQPTSRAGAHPFALVVTSPDYPDRQSQREAELQIKPYFDFTLRELAPKQQTISWFKRSGETVVSIINKGNSAARFKLVGTDNRQSCSFEFHPPGEEVTMAQQVEVDISPESTMAIPTQITPYARPLAGLRAYLHDFAITVSVLAEQPVTRTVSGQLSQRSLIGPWQILSLMLLLLLFSVYMFRPAIYLFSAEPQRIRAGEGVTLRWQASPFANLQINNGIGPLEGATGEIVVVPEFDSFYQLRAENWLSWFFPFFNQTSEVAVQVEPVLPIIRVFSVDKETIVAGEEVTLAWEVLSSDELILQTNGAPEAIPATEHASQRVVSPINDTFYTLIAHNRYGETTLNLSVTVIQPTPTPVPTPFVKNFAVNPSVIIAGTPVIIEWEVEGADTVSVSPLGSNLPPSQSVSQSPLQNTVYVLTASKGSAASQPIAAPVFVTPAANLAIQFFTAEPAGATPGVGNPVQLRWSVSGESAYISEVSPPPDFQLKNTFPVSQTGTLSVTATQSTLFILTVYDESGGRAEQAITVPPSKPIGMPAPTATATPLP